MLKRLELTGFKSFADKTDLVFSDGVTAIVGPNGSGKSNVVDAVRWVLGEQSAKSLRSGGMSEVIFNGSTSRKSLGMAEVTMVFDNARRALATDDEEVQITRRVYRSGESEYLINRHPSRLKDIKDLFLGSGAGTNAYSIIEQGRVDGFLQASAKERRSVFEEAAGISRFKAKKIETLRKLERVDQNVERLKDILEEVDKQLRSVRLQAAKAQRYQEYSQRLKELRIALGLQDYHELATELESATTELETLRSTLNEDQVQVQSWEEELHALEQSLSGLEELTHEQEAQLNATQQQMTEHRSTWNHESELLEELQADYLLEQRQCNQLTCRLTELSKTIQHIHTELTEVEELTAEGQSGVATIESEIQQLSTQIDQLQEQIETDKTRHLELMRQAGHLQNDVVSYRAEMDNLQRTRERLREKTDQASDTLASVEKQLEELSNAEEALQTRLETAKEQLSQQRKQRETLGKLREETRQSVADLRAQRSGVTSRISLLEGLERAHEGLGTGVREVYELMEQPDPGPWRTVQGIIADFLNVRREFAPLIDLALGERAQHFLVRDPVQLREALDARGFPFSGRVSFFALQPNQRVETSRLPAMGGRSTHPPGVVALAEQVVTCDDPALSQLPQRLLARTVIVHDLAIAHRIAGTTPGLRFITLEGELLEPDGTLTVGDHHEETGILSRKSELRELRVEVGSLDRRIHEIELDLRAINEQIAEVEADIEKSQQEVSVLTEQAADLRSRVSQHKERRDGLHEEVIVSQSEISGLEQEIESLEEALQRAQVQATQAEEQVGELQQSIVEAEREARLHAQERAQRQEIRAESREELAKVEERRSSLQKRLAQFEEDHEQRYQEQANHLQRLEDLHDRIEESQLTLLNASANLASAFSVRERLEGSLSESLQLRTQQRQRRQELSEQAQNQRSNWQAGQSQAHQQELTVNDLRHRLSTLVDRLTEDYGVDLTQIYIHVYGLDEPTPIDEPELVILECSARTLPVDLPQVHGLTLPPEMIPEQVPTAEVIELPTLEFVQALGKDEANDEIEELKRKLHRLGSVNLEALDELAEQEMRANALQIQYEDLTTAKRTLEDIIDKINGDSQRLFGETFTDIRTHFQELFRKLFGGGQADIILEDDNDILDCGIEIIARPPGKELRSISQMSGGERTMTAVALLLAVFRSKPSPFCILDEVDAALDEANVGRLSSVLREFMSLSQFIMITHHKRTMASADVLVGVTMQEPGVSKLMTVRFEDWTEENQAA